MGTQEGQAAFVAAAKQAVLTTKPECGQGEVRGPTGGCPIVGESAGSIREAECPVISEDFDSSNMMPSTSNMPSAEQQSRLGTERVPSSIPTASAKRPAHQDAGTNVWMYPSEQMFFNAMKRKGWKPQEADMRSVVSIHNAVNERAWNEVMRWEQMHCNTCKEPKLKRFMGRPKDVSPKARLLNLLGYKLPFDRHDWIVSRCGKEVRYVIDFYNAAPLDNMPVALHLDVRPALDSPEALWDRLKLQFAWVSSGRWLESTQ